MAGSGVQAVLRRVLAAAREELGMDVAWVSRFEPGRQVFTVVEGAAEQFGIADGSSTDLAGSYCTRVLSRDLPAVVSDAAADPRTAALAVTETMGIGSYAGVPIVLPTGDLYGMLCCVGRGPNHGITDQGMRFLRLLAEAAAIEVVENEAEAADIEQRKAPVEAVLNGGGLRMVVQPIVGLSTMRVIGAEALARFEHGGGPDTWFAEAAAVGRGLDLELLAVRRALALLHELDHGIYLAVNASPEAASDPRFAELLLGSDATRLVIEITEHAAVADYDQLHDALRPLRAAGARLAVDDAGAGFASFRHILALRPDIIKLDVALTSDIDSDPVRQALARALVEFAGGLSATLVAEGVETQTQLDTLLRLGFDSGQGYFLARPAPLPLPSIDVRPVTRLRRQSAPVEALAAVAERTANARTFDDFMRPILEAVVGLTEMDAAYLSAVRGENLVRTHVHNTDRYTVKVGAAYPWHGSLCHQCLDAAIIWTADVTGHLVPGPEDSDIRSFLSMPVVSTGDEVVGTLCAISTDSRYLSDRVVAQLQLLARLVGDRMAREHAKI